MTSRPGAFNTLDIPIKFIAVEMEGVSIIIKSHALAGEPEIGRRVVPIFHAIKSTDTIIDLAFVVEGTKEGDLPE